MGSNHGAWRSCRSSCRSIDHSVKRCVCFLCVSPAACSDPTPRARELLMWLRAGCRQVAELLTTEPDNAEYVQMAAALDEVRAPRHYLQKPHQRARAWLLCGDAEPISTASQREAVGVWTIVCCG